MNLNNQAVNSSKENVSNAIGNAEWVLQFLKALEANEKRHAPVETMNLVLDAMHQFSRSLESVNEWCFPDKSEMPADLQARCDWYQRRLCLIANATRLNLKQDRPVAK